MRLRATAHGLIASALCLLAASCGGGGGGDAYVPGQPTSYVAITGRVSFDLVPTTSASGLDYASTTSRPARGVIVKAMDSSGAVEYSSSTTADDGSYTLSAPGNTSVIVRAYARMQHIGAASWDISVVDNTNAKAMYVMQSAAFDSGSGAPSKNLHADSGWDGASYSSTRAAAPFAILDTLHKAMDKITAADPYVQLPALKVNWSANNVPLSGSKSMGRIGTTHYSPTDMQIYVLGKADNDTDEYDDHVIAHEFGHYMEDRLSRSDSLGGSHGFGDRLDARVAFSEGQCTAFSAIATADPIYNDSAGVSQSATSYHMDVEDNDSDPASVGWYSEESVQSIIYDIYDASADGPDALSLGYAPIHDALMNWMGGAESFTTIYSFIERLRAQYPSSASEIGSLLAHENISASTSDGFDSALTETNGGGSAGNLPVYVKLVKGAGAASVCGTGANGSYNALGNRRYFYIEAASSGAHTITVTGAVGDPDIVLYSRGAQVASAQTSGASETLSANLAAGLVYTGEIYDYNHITGASSTVSCFNLSLD